MIDGFLKQDSGFSLVETMIATFLFALVSAAGVMILSGYQDGRASLDRAEQRLAEIETARALIRSDLLAAARRPLRDAYGGARPGFEAGAQLEDGILVRLVRTGNMGAMLTGDGSSLDRVEYLLEGGDLVRRTYERTDVTLETGYRDRTLMRGIEGVDLRFETQGTWISEWLGNVLTNDLPRLMEMELTFEGGRELSLTFIVGGLV